MTIKLANAPVSWGVDYPNDAKNPPWPKVMSEIAEAGFAYTELGPYGYYPPDPVRLMEEFNRRGLTVTAAFVFQELHDPSKRDHVLGVAEKTIRLLSAIGGRHLVTIDHISKSRMATAGRPDKAERLDRIRQRHMIDMIRRIAELAHSFGIEPVIHQHAGCYIEFEPEVEAILDRIPKSEVGLCLDTGHMAYAGIDPVAFYRSHASRVHYFHFKDIDPKIHHDVVSNSIPFLDAVAMKVFCPMGRGVVDWKAMAIETQRNSYEGAATIEQDIDPLISLKPIEDARASLVYLRSVGF